MVESTAGAGIGYSDELYRQAGAEVVADVAMLFATAELIVKVKEPQAAECARLRPGQILFTYLHLAPDLAQTQALLASGATCIAYETVTQREGGLPLLAPMSAVAGRMSIQAGVQALEKTQGGRGILLGGVPGVEPAKVAILGGGVVGANAARMALGMRADVTLLDCNLAVLQRLDSEFQGRVKLAYSSREAIERLLPTTDLLIGGVLVPGAAAPKLVSRAQVATMRPGSAIVDVAIDHGGMRGDLASNHPPSADLCRGGRGALLRREYAGGGGLHRDAGAEQRDAALYSGLGRSRLGGVASGCGIIGWIECDGGAVDLPGGGAGTWPELYRSTPPVGVSALNGGRVAPSF